MYWTVNWPSAMPNSDPQDYTLSFVQANAGALFLAVPVCAVYILLYAFIYGWDIMGIDFQKIFESPALFLLLFVLGIVVHEGLHAISWAWLDNIPWKHVHFGFQWSTITPYVHCSVAVTAGNYRWGTALPGIILGILPFLLALVLQNGWLLGFGLLFTLAAGGDFLILWLLRNVEAEALVQDHPERIGCQVLNPNAKELTIDE